MILGQPKKKIKIVKRSRLAAPPRREMVDTGERREMVIYDAGGKPRTEQVPIMRPVYHEAVRQEVEEPKEVWELPVGPDPANPQDGTPPEVHEFASKEDADRFIRDTARDQIKRQARRGR